MSTSDQQGDQPLTRKQLREIRLTGATPVIGEEESAAAAAKKAQPTPAAPLPRPAQPADVPPAPIAEESSLDTAARPLTRRQARAQELLRTASVPVIEPDAVAAPDAAPVDDDEPSSAGSLFAPVPAQTRDDDRTDADGDAADDGDAETAETAQADEDTVTEAQSSPDAEDAAETDVEADADAEADAFGPVFGATGEPIEADDDEAAVGEGDELPVADAVVTGERPVVRPTFGTQVLGEKADVPAFSPSFDELITSDSGGSNRAPNTLIFTHPGEGSLSGPVASTGEVLVTGSYELPRGIGSQGHAHGAADGKDVDSVLIDGELPASSSPTPIAASSAVSTVKPAGEVIRPPAPDKGNKLMLILAITAGGLALALAVALIVAFTTNVF